MNTEQIKDMHLLYSAVYNEELREQFDEYNTAIYVEEWVNQLVEEGYDLSEYTWDDMVEIYNEQFTLGKKKTKKELARYVAALQTLQGNNEEPTTQSQSPGEPTRRRRTNLNDVKIREDIYDTILSHLIDEGYAESVEQAEVIMVNMSEDWREEILDEAVRGSGRSIADRITGNDIRGVTRGNKSVYKKPKWKDDVENEVDREVQSTRRTQTSNTYDGGRDSETIKANKKSINRMNAAKNIEDKQADGDYENSIDHSNPTKGKSGYMEVPTDYRARKRRASGR
jgi:hypothetical protein